jgi:hypothetical protein
MYLKALDDQVRSKNTTDRIVVRGSELQEPLVVTVKVLLDFAPVGLKHPQDLLNSFDVFHRCGSTEVANND